MVKYKFILLRFCLLAIVGFIACFFIMRTTTFYTRSGRCIVKKRISLLGWDHLYDMKENSSPVYYAIGDWFAENHIEDKLWIVDDRSTLIEFVTFKIGRTPSRGEKRIFALIYNDPLYIDKLTYLRTYNPSQLVHFIDAIYDCVIRSTDNCNEKMTSWNSGAT